MFLDTCRKKHNVANASHLQHIEDMFAGDYLYTFSNM